MIITVLKKKKEQLSVDGEMQLFTLTSHEF